MYLTMYVILKKPWQAEKLYACFPFVYHTYIFHTQVINSFVLNWLNNCYLYLTRNVSNFLHWRSLIDTCMTRQLPPQHIVRFKLSRVSLRFYTQLNTNKNIIYIIWQLKTNSKYTLILLCFDGYDSLTNL